VHELGLQDAWWRKSRRSSGNGQCIEVTHLGWAVAVRDSKDSNGPKLAVSPSAWRAFTRAIKEGTAEGR
jgi:Domain of unknown function (DUF397)